MIIFICFSECKVVEVFLKAQIRDNMSMKRK